MARRRVTVQEAADALGISVDAIRQRIRRGQLERAEADDPTDNRVYVWLNVDQTESKREPDIQLLESLQDQVSYLREQLAAERRANDENRRLLAAALERIPQLEAPGDAEAPSAATSDAEATDEPQGSPQPRPNAPGPQEGAQRSWWRRVFR